jgi:hypothetical protein
MTEEQIRHIGEARIASDRAMLWAEKAEKCDFVILAGFWREVHNMLQVGIDLQKRAFRDNSLLTQTAKESLQKTTGRLFNEPGSTKTKE